MTGLRQFLVAGRDRPVLREPVDRALDLVALPIGVPVEADPPPRFVPLAGNHGPDPAAAQIAPNPAAGVALVARDPVGPQPGANAFVPGRNDLPPSTTVTKDTPDVENRGRYASSVARPVPNSPFGWQATPIVMVTN